MLSEARRLRSPVRGCRGSRPTHETRLSPLTAPHSPAASAQKPEGLTSDKVRPDPWSGLDAAIVAQRLHRRCRDWQIGWLRLLECGSPSPGSTPTAVLPEWQIAGASWPTKPLRESTAVAVVCPGLELAYPVGPPRMEPPQQRLYENLLHD